MDTLCPNWPGRAGEVSSLIGGAVPVAALLWRKGHFGVRRGGWVFSWSVTKTSFHFLCLWFYAFKKVKLRSCSGDAFVFAEFSIQAAKVQWRPHSRGHGVNVDICWQAAFKCEFGWREDDWVMDRYKSTTNYGSTTAACACTLWQLCSYWFRGIPLLQVTMWGLASILHSSGLWAWHSRLWKKHSSGPQWRRHCGGPGAEWPDDLSHVSSE